MPCQFTIQNKIPYMFSFQGGKGTHIKITRGVYVKITRGVYCKTLEVYTVKTLEVFVYQIFTGGDMLIIPNIELM